MNERDRDRGDRDRDRGDRDRGDRDFDDRGGRGGRRRGTKKKVDPFIADKTLKIDWRDPSLLGRFISDRGKIVPRRISGNCALHQRSITTAIKRARNIALMPFTSGS